MDLSRTPNEEKVRLSRIYFIGGFAFLPFLWFVNVVWFFREAFFKDEFDGQTQVSVCECVCVWLFSGKIYT